MYQLQFNIARLISIIGHPFLLLPLLTGLIAYRLLPPAQALIAEIIALGIVIIPATFYTFIKVRMGKWNDLDVSDQNHRGQFYVMLLSLLSLLTLIAWLADVPRSIAFGTTAILLLVVIAFLLNPRIKISLHTGFSIFVACVMLLIQPFLALVAFVLAASVAWSRVILGRHTRPEVMWGGLLGGVVGSTFILVLKFIS